MASIPNDEENLERSEPSAAEPSQEAPAGSVSPEFKMMAEDICKDLSQQECTILLQMIAARQAALDDGRDITMTDYESAKGME